MSLQNVINAEKHNFLNHQSEWIQRSDFHYIKPLMDGAYIKSFQTEIFL